MKTIPKNLEGFTMVEMIIAMAVSAMIMAFATLAYTTLYRTYMIERGYRDIHEDARKAISMIDKDVRAATRLPVTAPFTLDKGAVVLPASTASSFHTNGLMLQVPVVGNTDSNAFYIIVYKTEFQTLRGFSTPVGILYRYVYTNGVSTPISSQQVTRNPIGLEFKFYKNPGQLSLDNVAQDTAEVRTYLSVTNQVLNTVATDRIQVRTKLRNKAVIE